MRPGNKNAAKGKRYRDAIRKALAQYEDDEVKAGKALEVIGKKLVGEALNPDSKHYEFAVKEIGNRIDGSSKESGESATEVLRGISVAFNALEDFARARQVIDGEVVVPDRSVLPAEVRIEAGGHGEGVDIPKDQGGPEGA